VILSVGPCVFYYFFARKPLGTTDIIVIDVQRGEGIYIYFTVMHTFYCTSVYIMCLGGESETEFGRAETSDLSTSLEQEPVEADALV